MNATMTEIRVPSPEYNKLIGIKNAARAEHGDPARCKTIHPGYLLDWLLEKRSAFGSDVVPDHLIELARQTSPDRYICRVCDAVQWYEKGKRL